MRFTPLFVGAFVLTAIRVGCDLMIPNLMSEVIDTVSRMATCPTFSRRVA